MMQIFIEGQEADIDEQFSTLLTASVNDIKSFGTKESTFSKTIILPGTKRNNKLFGNIFNTTTRTAYNPALANYGYNFNASVSAKVLVMNQNIQQMKGTIRLLQINVDGAFIDYEVSIVGELGGFSAKMGGKRLVGNDDKRYDLDFSAHNHAYTINNIKASWDSANAGAGYYYPLIDYGTYGYTAAQVLGGKHSWNYNTFKPALFVKQYIDKIFALAGYTYECDLFNTDRFKRLIIPYNQKKLIKEGTTIVGCTPQNTTGCIDQAYPMPVQWQDFSGTNWTINGGSTGSVFTYTGLDPAVVQFKVDLTFTASTTNTPVNNGIYIETLKNGVVISGSVKYIPPFSGLVDNFYIVNLVDEPVVTGDYYQVQARADDTGMCYDSLINQSGFISISSDTPVILNVNLGDVVSLNDCIPKNILQRDFFASILKLFNLYVYEDINKERHLIIKPYIDFHDGVTEDWSNKVDRSKVINIKPMSELNARYYEFKYKDDSDYWNDLYKKRYNETYGSVIYDSGFEFASEKLGVELIFSPTPLVGYQDEDKVYPTIYKRTNDQEEIIDSNIRIMLAKKVTGVDSWEILGGPSPINQTVYGYAGHFNDPDSPSSDLNFGIPKEIFFVLAGGALNVNQFNVYYTPYMAEITDKDSKLLSCTLRLTKKDWYELSFSKYKWIDGSLWRLNKITDYNATNEDSCKAEFIKLIEKKY